MPRRRVAFVSPGPKSGASVAMMGLCIPGAATPGPVYVTELPGWRAAPNAAVHDLSSSAAERGSAASNPPANAKKHQHNYFAECVHFYVLHRLAGALGFLLYHA